MEESVNLFIYKKGYFREALKKEKFYHLFPLFKKILSISWKISLY